MTFLLDQGLPRSTVQELMQRGIVAEHIADLGLAAATDANILQTARDRGMVVVTLDADFHALLAATGQTTPSVIRIRIERLKGPQIAALIEQVIAAGQMELIAGAAVSVNPGRIRIRMLPLV
jgi:predicted nuclease of predicted toxin-antitoxin system